MRATSNGERQTSKKVFTFHVSRFTFVDVLLALIVATLAALLYLRTLAPGVLGGDSGEFQFAAWLGGFAHPTGYPLYLLLGYLWTHLLPIADAAWRMNAFSALWGAVAVGLLYLLARQMLQMAAPATGWPIAISRLLALLAAAIFAVTTTFWSQAVVAEVYALNAALIIAILLALVTWAARGRMRALYLAAFLFGLSLAHHRTTLLWIPAIAMFMWVICRPQDSMRGHELARSESGQSGEYDATQRLTLSLRHLITLSLLVLAPLLLYVTIPLTAPATPYVHVQVGPNQTLELYKPTLDGFLNYVTGREFESEFRSPMGALGRVLPGLRLLAAEVTWPGVVLGVLGLIWLARRSRPLLVLTGLGFLTLFIFNLFYGIGDIAVYYIPLYALWALWIACGVGGIIAAVRRGLSRTEDGGRKTGDGRPLPGSVSPGHLVTLSLCLLALLLPLYLLLTNFVPVDQSRNTAARDFWEATLAQPIPQNAILVTNDRDEMMPLWYMQYVEGQRPDLTGLFPLIQPTPDWADVGASTDAALRSGRPVLLIKEMPGLDIKFKLMPEGKLVSVLGPAVSGQPARPAEARFGEAIRLLGYDIRPATLAPGDTVTVSLHWQPLRPLDADYTTFAHLVNADGRVIGASDHRPGGVYYPTSLWKPGETLVDAHTLTLASDLGRPPYALEVGLYTGEKALRHLGQPQQVGMIGGARPPAASPANLAQRLDAAFGGQIALAGYETAVEADRLALKLHWQA
ncbi:MAG: DUF2723 domain-containing protein, partial [Anaerolineae bacterium]|nr:DUF2723 domain-containing protein [Anaerolineae bacterium]